MKGKSLRDNKTCLNCGETVEVRYCSYCGQENTKLDQPFYHAFLSYFQNKTKYDKGLLKSIKLIITKPSFLSSEFLKGKRASHIEPVRFYIAVSFIVLFITSILFGFHQKQSFRFYYEPEDDMPTLTEETIKLMDQKSLEANPSLYFIYHPFYEKLISLKKNNWTDEEISDKIMSKFVINIPTALFIYLPIFTLLLWLFHNKEKWTYYKHSIFSLHYFTLLMLSFCMWYILETIQILVELDFVNSITSGLQCIIYLYCLTYFILACYRFYNQKKLISFIKSTLLIAINVGVFCLILIGLLYYTFVTID